jgi:molecular chaperone Hsp33
MNEVQSFLLEESGIRGALVRLHETWLQIVAQHLYPPQVRSVLGESIAATVLMANGLKGQPKIALQLQGDGPVSLLVIQCARDLKVRAMAKWRAHDPSDQMLGEGKLAVMLDTGDERGVFQGIVPLVSTKLYACLESYFERSEQLATRIMLSASELGVAGLMLQTLPGHEHAESFDSIAEQMKGVTPEALRTTRAEALLPALFGDQSIRLFEARPVLHDCRCTPDHLAGIARLLGAEELAGILAERGNVELTCEFCNRIFQYDAANVDTINRGETPVATLH